MSASTVPATITRERGGLVLGPAVFAAQYLFTPIAMPPEAAAALAGTLWIAIWWMTEAVPIPVTALLPIVLFPLTGVLTVTGATTPYADPIVFLLLGGFLLALSVERWNLHERLALVVIDVVGFGSRRLVLGFMVATGFLSMWISNTATAMMMVPIGTAVIAQLSALTGEKADSDGEVWSDDGGGRSGDGRARSDGGEAAPDPNADLVRAVDVDPSTLPSTNFGIAVMLGIAYGASIGGAATLIGSPPNAILAGVAASALDVRIGFLDWMLFALPVSAVFLLVAWALLVTTVSPEAKTIEGGRDLIRARLDALGAMSRGERRTLAVFGLVVVGWVTRPFLLEPVVPAVTDTVIAIVGAVLLFVVPVDREEGTVLLDWETTSRLPWGVLILLGAGFSIAAAFQASGLDRWIAERVLAVGGVGLLGVLLLVGTVVVFVTEVNSNTATASVFLPIMVGVGYALGVSPLSLMAVTALTASYAFMLPVATPPNAIVFGSGYMTVPQMARVGVRLNVLGVLLATAATYLWLPIVFW